jgi:hypothetical protein
MEESHEMTLSNGQVVLLVPVYGKGAMRTEALLYWEAWHQGVGGSGVGISEALVDLSRARRNLN